MPQEGLWLYKRTSAGSQFVKMGPHLLFGGKGADRTGCYFHGLFLISEDLSRRSRINAAITVRPLALVARRRANGLEAPDGFDLQTT
jgi:hypothetical protein